ncbi:hypothetical protein [Cetobacterium somerae]
MPIDSLFVLFGFITYRVISRAFEIIRAFYIDIIDSKKKNVFINSNQRIVLATKSYFEIILNFTTLNFLGTIIYKKFKYNYFVYFFELGSTSPRTSYLNLPSLSNIFYKSFGITTFTDASINSIFGALQIITTLVLVLFALAGYLNNKGG